MISIQEYQELLKSVPKLKDDLAREQGALDQLTKSLLEEHGVSSLEELEALESKLNAEAAKLKKEIEDGYQKYIESYSQIES